MEPLVSVVIPVYNLDHALLDSCVFSILNQTYQNIEILIVDDGSTDGTGEYCDTLKNVDGRIRVFHQKNNGVSAARNNGTNIAAGDYILYVDGDDILSPIAIREGMDHIQNDGVDLVIACVQKIKTHSDFVYTKEVSENSEVLHGIEIDEIRKHLIALNNPRYKGINGSGYINRGPYCRLIRKEIALSNPFTLGIPIGEDVLWNMNLLNKCDSVCVVYNIWYGYLIHGQSAIRKYYGNREILVRKYLDQLLRDNSDFFKNHMEEYAKNVSVEFYCLLNYELMSEKCPMSKREKKEAVREYLRAEPWNMLERKEIKKSLPFMYRSLFALCPSGLWIWGLRLFELAKGRKMG